MNGGWIWDKLRNKAVTAAIGSGVAITVIAALVINAALTTDIIQNQDILAQREAMATTVALSHLEVKNALKNVSGNDISIRHDWLDSNVDRVTITARGSLNVEPLHSNFTGSFDRQSSMFGIVRIDVKRLVDATGYTETFTQNQKIEVDVDRRTNEVLSVRLDSAPDIITHTKFTDGERKALSIVLADGRVKDIIGETEFYLTQIRESGVGFEDQSGQHCGEQECSLVGLALASQESFGVHTAIILNPNTREIVDLRSGS